MLKFIARHATIFMPLCALLGFIFPKISLAIFPYLPQILFFLMLFTLLGLDQKKLLLNLGERVVWAFAVFQSVAVSLICGGVAYLLGIRGDLLLAIVAMSATAPLFGSGAMVNAIGFDALLAMAKTIAATLLMPITILIVLYFFGDENASINLIAYFERLAIYIVLPMLLAFIIRKSIPTDKLLKYYLKIAPFNILLLLMFPLGLIGSFRVLFDQNVHQAIYLLILSSILALVYYFLAYFAFRRYGNEIGIVAALVCTGRNTMLAYIIATPFLGAMFLPLIGVFQLPLFCLPLLAKYMAKNKSA